MNRDMKQWLSDMISADRKTALPILSFPSVSLLGVTVRELISDSDRQAQGMKLVAERVNAAAAVSLMDLSVEAECFGATIRVSDEEVPTVIGRLVGDEDEAEQAAEPAKKGLTIEPVAEGVTFDVFSQSDMRVVHVKECVAVPKSKKLLQFTLDDGSGQDRTILSGIHDYYEPEDLVGKNVVAIVNIPPRKMMGVESCGMLLSAIHEVDGQERLNLLMVDDAIPAGSKLY